ncbi:MAG: hypothetical protein OEW12_08970 [Deltaproteobacteria bacterium]|nr:hypothetical protein [Deltaproteobacteria bacterium]
MSNTQWELEARGPGRLYQLPKDMFIRYDETEPIVEAILAQLKGFIQLESSVRLVLDSPYVTPAQAIIAVPFEGEDDTIFRNLAAIVYQQLWGYYLSADPKATHHGLTNLVFEGSVTNLIRREAEKFLTQMASRHDMAGRMMRGYRMACETSPFNRDVYLKQVVSQSLNIHLGVRMYTHGLGVNRVNAFLPIAEGGEAVDRIYYNLEHIIHQNFVSYDELHDRYLPVGEELILREVETVLDRARKKHNTRLKLINGLKLHTVMLEDPSMAHNRSLADLYYDKINRIDLLEESAQRSRDMFASALIRSTEITTAAVNVDKIKMEERVYIERPAEQSNESEVQKVPVSVRKDGLSEL